MTIDHEDLILRLYCSTEHMAHLPCSDMELWNEHSNAVLKAATIIKELVEERDHWRTKAEALQAEVDTLKKALFQMQEAAKSMVPVVDAAVACVHAGPVMMSGAFNVLINAVRTYQSKQAPAEPVKNCTTCRHAKASLVKGNCPACLDYDFWEPRHD